MTLVQTPFGVVYPNMLTSYVGVGSAGTMDAATEKYAMIGRLYIDGRPTSSKTLSSSGGSISWRTGTVTFANATTSLDVGIQDVASGSGPIAQPDGTFDVKKTCTSSVNTPSSNGWQTTTMGTGTKTMTQGDLIAVVWDMTARGGVDSVIVTASGTQQNQGFPVTNAFVSSAWQTTATIGAGSIPNVLITFDDGTLATLDGTFPVSTETVDSVADATSPDERGLMFQVPWKCKIDAIWFIGGITDAGSDFTLNILSDPTGSPSSLGSITVLAEQLGVISTTTYNMFNLATEISLNANTNYCVTMRATGTTNTRLRNMTLGATGHRALIAGGTTLAKITRDGGSGAFTAETPAVTIYNIGVRISSFDDGMGTPSPTYVLGI